MNSDTLNFFFSAMGSLTMFCPKECGDLFELLHIVHCLFFSLFTDEKCKCWPIICRHFLVCLKTSFELVLSASVDDVPQICSTFFISYSTEKHHGA